MTNASLPIRRVLVPYDGSAPADGALAYAIAFGRAGAAVDILHVVDQAAAVAPSAAGPMSFDPIPLLEALDEQGRAVLESALQRARAAGVETVAELAHGAPVPAIVAAAAQHGDDLIVLGTHARTGLARTFLGSVTEGVLRSGITPVLAVRAVTERPAGSPIKKLLVAVDDSDPADAAATFAGRLARSLGATCTFVHALDTTEIYAKAKPYGYDPEPFVQTLRELANETIELARRRADLGADDSCGAVIEAKPVEGIILEADRCAADAIVIGSHGRRGLHRLFLGSVAEQIVRQTPIPVFVVRCAPHTVGKLANVETPGVPALQPVG